MVEHVKGETLSEVPLEVRLHEVVSPVEEIPSVIKLDASQLREVVTLIFVTELVVDSICCKSGSHASSTSDELLVLAGDRI